MIGHSLSLQNVTKRFGNLTAVEDISFDVRPREFISVIGPSGCGKSTLFNIIGGFVGGYEGTLLLDGQAKVARRSIGMVFQEESTFPWRTTLQNVAFPLEVAGVPQKEREARARELISLVGLTGFENNYPAEMSGGMRQRTAIAHDADGNPVAAPPHDLVPALQRRIRFHDDASLLPCRSASLALLGLTHAAAGFLAQVVPDRADQFAEARAAHDLGGARPWQVDIDDALHPAGAIGHHDHAVAELHGLGDVVGDEQRGLVELLMDL